MEDFIPDDEQQVAAPPPVIDDFTADDFVADETPTDDFNSWYSNVAKQYNLNPDPDAPEQMYDYRAAHRDKAMPDASGHWPSQYKKAGHPNEIVGGYNTRTALPEPGYQQVQDVDELIKLGWDANTARELVSKQGGQPGFLKRAWDAANKPLTDIPSQFADSIANVADRPRLDENYLSDNNPLSGAETFGRRMNAMIRGGIAGLTEGVGDFASGMTSPLNLLTAGLASGEVAAGKYGLKGLEKALEYGTKIASAPVVAHGAGEVFSPDSTMAQRGQGLVEIAGGLSGFRSRIKEPIKAPINEPAPIVEEAPINLVDETSPAIVDEPIESKPAKPRVRLNRDGTYTNLDTGEVLDPNKPMQLDVPEPGSTKLPPVGSEPNLGPVTKEPKLTIKKPTLATVSQAVKDGYKYVGQNPDGSYQFEYTGEPQQPNRIGKINDAKKQSKLDEAFNFPRAVMASLDFSAPLRQGLGFIHKKAFWNSLDDMFRAWGSEESFRQIQDSILNDTSGLFKPREYVTKKGVKVKKSIAENAGLAIMDLTDLTKREEALASTWAEKIPGVRRSNRAYTAFLNKLRADTFKQLMKDANVIVGDIDTNQPFTKELANFVNTATGRGSLNYGKRFNLEQHASLLNRLMFSPRLMASRINLVGNLFNPYASKTVRMETLKSLGAIVGFGNTLTFLAKQIPGAEVETDPASADFGKIKFGDTRIDPYAGFQQYAVQAKRQSPSWMALGNRNTQPSNTGFSLLDSAINYATMPGARMKSSTTGVEYDLTNPKYGGSNKYEELERFTMSKAHPVISFVRGLLKNQDPMNKRLPFDVKNELVNRMTPIIAQDVLELLSEDPKFFPGLEKIGEAMIPGGKPGNFNLANAAWAIPAVFGMSINQYERDRR